MPKKRDTYKYRLKDGNKVIYIGITKDPERRAREHKVDEKRIIFEVVGRKVSEDSAREWEDERLKAYRSDHKGRNPKYNKGKSG